MCMYCEIMQSNLSQSPWVLVFPASAAVEAAAAVVAFAVLAAVVTPAAAKVDCFAGPRERCCWACPAAG